MPVSFYEGVRDDQRADIRERNMERRFHELAAAVRDHEASSRKATPTSRMHDERLYRSLRRICGQPTTEEHRAAR